MDHKFIGFLFMPFVLFTACSGGGQQTDKKEATIRQEHLQLEEEVSSRARVFFQPLEASAAESEHNALSEAKIKLGKILYFDATAMVDHLF